MTGRTCVVCGNNSKLDSKASFHRFPSAPERRLTWLRTFGMEEHELRAQSRVCSRHFPDGDTKRDSSLALGKRFASPVKISEPRAKRAKSRDVNKTLFTLRASAPHPGSSSGSGSLTPVETSVLATSLFTASFGEQLDTNYTVHELPCPGSHVCESPSTSNLLTKVKEDSIDYVVNAGLLSKI